MVDVVSLAPRMNPVNSGGALRVVQSMDSTGIFVVPGVLTSHTMLITVTVVDARVHLVKFVTRELVFSERKLDCMKTVSYLFPWISVSFDETLEDVQELEHHCDRCGTGVTSKLTPTPDGDIDMKIVRAFEAQHCVCKENETQKLTIN